MVSGDAPDLDAARRALLQAMGPEALVDAVAVASNFERMVRIADATGIPLDTPVLLMSEGLREDLGIDGFAAAANTPPPSPLARRVARILRPLLAPIVRIVGKRMMGSRR